MTEVIAADRVWWAPFDSHRGDETPWHALPDDPQEAGLTERAWAVCDWVGYVHFKGRTLPPILCSRCWRAIREVSPEAVHRLVTPEQWRNAFARTARGSSDANG